MKLIHLYSNLIQNSLSVVSRAAAVPLLPLTLTSVFQGELCVREEIEQDSKELAEQQAGPQQQTARQ